MRALSLALIVCWSACSSSSDRDGDGDDGSDTQALIETVRADGFAVQEGAVVPFYLEDCAALPSCYGSNATSPYALWHLPPAPGGAMPDQQGIAVPRTPPGMGPVWYLRDDEVLLYIGRTPPRAAYFSFAPYLFARVDPATGQHVEVFASLADATNLASIETAGDGPFDADTVLIVTASREMEERARSWLTASGHDERAFNTVVIPAESLRLGLAPSDDVLMMLQRFALFEDPAAGRAYLDAPPVSLLRITPASPVGGELLDVPARGQRGTGTTEDALAPALDELERAIRRAHLGRTPRALVMLPASAVDFRLDPDRCIAEYASCLGEVTDTTYSAGPAAVVAGGGTLLLSDDADDFLIAYGVNHEASGKATYSNVIVQNQARLAGVASMTSREMAGSAVRYLPDHPDAASLFAIKIARRCEGESYCLELATEFPGIPLDESLAFTFRAYLEPGRSLSAAPDELLTERLLHFEPAASR
jgi:hypothetical protein